MQCSGWKILMFCFVLCSFIPDLQTPVRKPFMALTQILIAVIFIFEICDKEANIEVGNDGN